MKKLMEKSDCGWEESREHVDWIFNRKTQKGPGEKGRRSRTTKGTDSTALIENQWC